MGVFLLAILLGLIPASIAKGKGRSFVLWWFYGAALFIVALPHSLMMKADSEGIERQQLSEGMKKCPYCAEFIKMDAIVCRYCGRDIPLPSKEVAVSVDNGIQRPQGISIGEWRERLMARYQIKEQGSGYLWKGVVYPSFDHVVEAIKSEA